jgi:hypothetical protein
LPSARAGAAMDGLDCSRELLAVLKRKLESEPGDVRARVRLFEGDMRCFDLGVTYHLITVPFRPLQHLFTVDDQLAAFHCFNKHLIPGGKLAFNVFYPNFQLLEQTGEEVQDLEWQDPADPGITVRRSFIRLSVNKLLQHFDGLFIFRSYRGEELVNEERSKLRMSYYTYPHLQLLLRVSGFSIAKEIGSFEGEPISVCKEMIIVATKD